VIRNARRNRRTADASRNSWSPSRPGGSLPETVATCTATRTISAIDKPFLNAAGQVWKTSPRVETFGDHQENGTNDVHWLKVLVDARSREVFAYQEQIVPETA